MRRQTKRIIRKSLKRNERPKLIIDVFEYLDYLTGKTKGIKYKKPKWLIEAEKEEEKMTLEEEKEWLEKAIKVCEEKGIKGLREL
jgi:chaperonin cofactor prefoldin